MNHSGFIDCIITVAAEYPMGIAREHASIVIMNLALVDENKVNIYIFRKPMIECAGALDIVAYLALLHGVCTGSWQRWNNRRVNNRCEESWQFMKV